jgi:signal transduction histidine kinase
MLWSDPYIVIAVAELGLGFVIISLLMTERSRSFYFKFLYIQQTVANILALFVFLMRYIDFTSRYYEIDGVLKDVMDIFSEHEAISQSLLVVTIALTIMVTMIYFSMRSTEKQTIGNLFYSNTTPIAILNDTDLFDSNTAFREILDQVPLMDLRTKEKISIGNKTYLIKRYPISTMMRSYHVETLVLLDVSEQEYALKRLNLLDQRLSMISMLLKNKLNLLEKLIELKSKNRIAIELHDEIGHNLTLAVSVLDRMHDEKLRESIPDHSIERLLEEGKNITLLLSQDRKNTVTGKYLEEMLESYILYLKWVGIHVTLNVSTQQLKLKQESILTLYAICKEAFSNTVKYGNAGEVLVTLKVSENSETLELIIKDNGKGCRMVKEGNGLKAIRARVERNQGSFSYHGNDGFELSCLLPLIRMTEDDA